MNPHRPVSPLQQALRATLTFVLVAVVLRLIWGAIDPEMRDWSIVAVAPLSGLYTYLYASGRHRTIAVLLVALGVGGLLLFSGILLSDWWPTTRGDVPYVIVVFAFPVFAIGLGLQQLRQRRRSDATPSA